MQTAVIVLCFNGKKYLDGCLGSLKRQSCKKFSTILVDNGSSDGSVEYVKEKFKWVNIIENRKNLGFATGNNRGIRYALKRGAEHVVLLNQDTVVGRTFIETGLKHLKGSVGIVCPKIKYFGTNRIWYAGGLNISKRSDLLFGDVNRIIGHRGIGEEDRGQFKSAETEYACGCALFIKRAVIEKIGLLDPRFFMYFEDRDWSLRAAKNDYKILFVPSATVWHKVPLGSSEAASYFSPKRLAIYMANLARYTKKHFGLLCLILYLPKSVLDVAQSLLMYQRLKSLNN